MKNETNPQASKKGIGYHPPTPLCLKIHKSASNYITVEDEGNKFVEVKSSVFYRLETPTSNVSVFDRIGTQTGDSLKLKQVSTKDRLGVLKSKRFKKAKNKFPLLVICKEIESKVPSCMIRQSKWVVTTGELLKAKQ